MALKSVVDSLDEVPESLHAEYVERDGKFYLDVENLEAHHGVRGMATALAAVKKDKSKLQTENTVLKARTEGLPEEFDPAEYLRLKEEFEELKKDPANRGKMTDEEKQRMRDQYETRIRNLETKHGEAIAALQAKLDDSDGELGGILVGDGLTSALVEAGVDKKFLPATKALLRTSVKVVRDEDTGKRRAVVDTDMGEIDVKTFVSNWAKSDDGKVYVVPASGSGAGGGDRGGRAADNPFTHDAWNVTEQARVYRERGEAQAARLAAAAGTTIGGPRPAARTAAG